MALAAVQQKYFVWPFVLRTEGEAVQCEIGHIHTRCRCRSHQATYLMLNGNNRRHSIFLSFHFVPFYDHDDDDDLIKTALNAPWWLIKFIFIYLYACHKTFTM